MLRELNTADATSFWISVGLLMFAAAFLVVGLFRIVEFDGLGLNKFRKSLFVAIHIIGCFVFSVMMALLALDIHRNHETWVGGLFLAAMILLFPLHIYMAILRRVRSKTL